MANRKPVAKPQATITLANDPNPVPVTVVSQPNELVMHPFIQEQFDEMSRKFDQLVDIVGGLAEKVTAPTVAVVGPTSAITNATSVVDDVAEARVQTIDLTKRFPQAWREIVDRVLGPDFELEVHDTANGDFMAYIYVPTAWDRRGAKNDQLADRDHSTGLMRRASAGADLEVWCQRVQKTVKAIYPNYKP
jgi:hypothetical protein